MRATPFIICLLGKYPSVHAKEKEDVGGDDQTHKAHHQIISANRNSLMLLPRDRAAYA